MTIAAAKRTGTDRLRGVGVMRTSVLLDVEGGSLFHFGRRGQTYLLPVFRVKGRFDPLFSIR
jgi:hypothetical protein